MNIVFIDNFDSFSYNLIDELRQLHCKVQVYRNDVSPDFVLDKLAQTDSSEPSALVLSPGPSAPADAGNLLPIIRTCLGRYALLGVCLGHQAIAQALGADIINAPEICHGKSSPLQHDNGPIFQHIPNPVQAARYHSLIAANLPDKLTVSAHCHGMCMAYYCKDPRVIGLQFHPESILTTCGRQILQNCLDFLQAN